MSTAVTSGTNKFHSRACAESEKREVVIFTITPSMEVTKADGSGLNLRILKMSVGNLGTHQSRIRQNCFIQMCENAREARERIRGASSEENTNMNNKQITSSGTGSVLKRGKQELETADDDHLVPLLKNAERKSVDDLCKD
jgi:hypothetical protein